ncbi:MAG: molybdopterin oxidoreductase family protein [Desulfuromonadia bacterium]
MTRIARSACPFDCPSGCGLLVHLDGDRILRMTGDPDHPHSQGRLCPKMLNYERTVHSPRRLTTPLRRSGPKGSGSFVPIPWEDALPIIAERFSRIIDERGGEAILPYSYGGTMGLLQRNALHPLFHHLGASRLARTICTPAADHAWRAVMGDTPAPHPEEVGESDMIVLWGSDSLSTDIQFFHRVAAARRRGVPVIGIDVYETPTLHQCADRVILRPGTDGAFALGVMALLARAGKVDSPFLRSRVLGGEELIGTVLPRYTPERVAGICRITPDTLERFARQYGDARRAFIRVGGGLTRAGNGAVTVRTILALSAISGNAGRRGGGCFLGTSTGKWFSLAPLIREDLLGGRSPRTVNMNRLGEALTDGDPPVRALYVSHSNPAVVAPDSTAVRRGLLREDLFTVVHERFLTDTARFADIVLPATTSLEHPDIYRSYGSYTIQRVDAAIPPVGESRSNWETIRSLARLLGADAPLFSLTDDGVLDLLVASQPVEGCRFDRQRLDRREPVEFRLDPEEPRRFLTPDGRIRVMAIGEEPSLPDWVPPHGWGEEGRFPLAFMTAPTPLTLNSSFFERDDLRLRLGGEPTLLINPQDASPRGIADGDRVRVESPTGSCTFKGVVTPRTPPGVVVSPGVWWGDSCPDGSVVNMLTSQRLTDAGGGSTFADTRVEVTPAP